MRKEKFMIYRRDAKFFGFKDPIKLIRLSEEHTVAFKEEMQDAFQHGFMAYYKDDNQWQVLPDKDFYQSLEAEGTEAYEAVCEDGLFKFEKRMKRYGR